MLSVEGLVKTFSSDQGKVQAVHGVTLQVKAGEFYSLLGPSGCGKTTTLRCIAGLETPSDGEIALDGEVVFSRQKKRLVPVYKRNIGIVFQSYAIWPHMNVFDNVAYPLRYGTDKRPPGKEIRERVAEVLRLVHMDHLASRPATQLSGGQQQRVALARALSRRPKILLLDEPLSNLDAKLREEMRVELRDLLRQLGITAIYVTHDQLEALAMSDRIAVMLDGRIVQEGTPRDIYLRPEKGFVASFVGTINFVKGRLRVHGSSCNSVVDTWIGPMQCACSEAVQQGEEVAIGVRPESITVTRSGTQSTSNVFMGRMERVSFLGDFVSGEVSVGDQRLRVKMLPQDYIDAGENVYVVLPPELCRVVPN
jgi:iron(III) transport system ATP-binding protein